MVESDVKVSEGKSKQPVRPSKDGDLSRIADYVRFGFNCTIAVGSLYLLVRFILLVRSDVEWRRYQRLIETRAITEKCAIDYELNRCHPLTRLPALREQCEQWLRCMHMEVNSELEESGTLWASTLAKILNEFTEQISFRTVGIILTVTLSVILATNFAFGTYRVYHVQ
ncbi:HHL115Wp [Eremothecium sinecaudum]|uniref:HHL115Wp n=1 Tax=Eremothecium sinecaudum TaxID=45286 RepID=A0A0X8HWE6_9SACH|nr:HHL115Wp [Eremothecium sinecaudum]AMD22655.1 HHL115Wp [Eremothecium sinecaudum]